MEVPKEVKEKARGRQKYTHKGPLKINILNKLEITNRTIDI